MLPLNFRKFASIKVEEQTLSDEDKGIRVVLLSPGVVCSRAKGEREFCRLSFVVP